jgi:hypothetical protein
VSTTAYTAAEGRSRRYTTLHLGAVIAHGLSYLTTLWFVQWCWPAGDLFAQGVAGYVLEVLLFAFKVALWSNTPEGRGVGWTGVGLDGVINMGGLLPYAEKILTFPPIAAMLALLDVLLPFDLKQLGVPFAMIPFGPAPLPISASVLIVALGGGILLSAGPQRLWRVAERRS